MNDSLSEMQSFEIEGPKVDFTKPPYEISRQILRLPLGEQQHWIDLWMDQPDIKADRERQERIKRESEMQHPMPINMYKKIPQDRHWQD